MTLKNLTEILLAVPEYKPQSVELLRQLRSETGQQWPRINPVQRQTCFREMSAYGERSSAMMEKLLKLKPVALQTADHDAIRSVFL